MKISIIPNNCVSTESKNVRSQDQKRRMILVLTMVQDHNFKFSFQ